KVVCSCGRGTRHRGTTAGELPNTPARDAGSAACHDLTPSWSTGGIRGAADFALVGGAVDCDFLTDANQESIPGGSEHCRSHRGKPDPSCRERKDAWRSFTPAVGRVRPETGVRSLRGH